MSFAAANMSVWKSKWHILCVLNYKSLAFFLHSLVLHSYEPRKSTTTYSLGQREYLSSTHSQSFLLSPNVHLALAFLWYSDAPFFIISFRSAFCIITRWGLVNYIVRITYYCMPWCVSVSFIMHASLFLLRLTMIYEHGTVQTLL